MAFLPLVFRALKQVTGDLVFGEGSDSSTLLRASITLGGPEVEVILEQLQPAAELHADLTLGGPDITVLLEASPVLSMLTTRNSLSWQEGARSLLGVGSDWNDSPSVGSLSSLPWAECASVASHLGMPWASTEPLRLRDAFPWREGDRIAAIASEPWQEADPLRVRFSEPWREGIALPERWVMPWQAGVALGHTVSSPYGPGTSRVASVAAPWGWASVTAKHVRTPWQNGETIESHGGGPFPIKPPGPTPCYTPNGELVFKFAPATDGSVVFRCDGHAPGPAATTVVPVRKVYTVLDTFQLRRASDNATLRPLNSASMSLDVNSWTWAFSFSLPLVELGMIEAASDGTPVEVIATVNGVEYRMLAERVTRDRQFPSGAVRVECRGIGGALDVLTGAYGNASGIRSASQIMGDILTVNGAGIGWAIDFGLEDWNVAAGQWAHTGTAVSALQAVAQSAGGYLQPHPTLKTIRVLPKYPVLPWGWAAATPDLELPSAVVTRESIEWVEKPRYNRVYVAGQGQGVLCRVTRAGTDGAILAPQVVDPLIATAVAGRQRGGTILADTGRQAIITLSLPILAETGIIPPGKLVRYVDGVDSRIGLTRSVSVTINRAGSRQTIGIETHA